MKRIIFYISLLIISLVLAFVSISYWRKTTDTREEETIGRIRFVREELETYRKACNAYPIKLEYLSHPNYKDCPNWKGGNFRSPPEDAWSREYIYLSDGKSYRLISLGFRWIEATDNLEASIVGSAR
jgi:general secretion pathway protein G